MSPEASEKPEHKSGKPSGIDPYNSDTAVKPGVPEETATKPPRKSIDDLRKLSNAIKQRKSARNPKQ